MILLEYIKTAFVIIGSLVIASFIVQKIAGLYRKNSLYKMGNELMTSRDNDDYEENNNHSARSQDKRPWKMIIRKEIPNDQRNEFLSKVSIEDISSDPFLKEVVDSLLADYFPIENSDGITALS